MRVKMTQKTKPSLIYDLRMTIDDLKTGSDTWRESMPIGMGRFHAGDVHHTKINQSLVTRRHCVMARQASHPTYGLKGTAVHISAFRSRLGFDQPSPGYGPARRRENSRLFPPFPPLTAFGGSFVFVKNVYTHPPSRRRFGATRNTQNTQTEPDGALAFPRGHHLRPGRARSPGTARSERRALPANATRDGGAPGANLPLHKGFPAFTLTRCVCVSSNLPATLESSHERRSTVP
jgi:hypothetical protein